MPSTHESGTQDDQGQRDKREIYVAGAGGPAAHYCDAVASQGMLYVSGIIPVNAVGALVSDDVGEQAEAVFARLKAVLAAEGCTYADIVKVTLFLTDIGDRTAINVVRGAYFGGHRPASTLVEVSGLVAAGAKLEVEAIARLPS